MSYQDPQFVPQMLSLAPQRQTTGDGTVVDYKYAFDGRKLQEKVTAGASVTQRDYSGEFLYEGGVLKKILFDGGYVINDVSGPVYMFFLTDHLSSVRAVVSETGGVQQINHYYPYGDLFPNTSNDSSGNRYKYTGKESGDEIGLYDFSARFLHTRFGRFTTIDPLAEKYPDISPYAYCNGNPVNFVDPDGRSTWVVANGDGTYSVKGGNLEDNDLNIYVVDYDEEGKIRIGESIGKSSSITSFYDSDNHAWKEGSIINPMDASGYDFISELIQSDPSLIEYILKARTNHAYDFKATNGTRSKIQGIDVYRGMPIAINSDGTTIYSSARDIGNMIAGYIAGSKGLTWWMARMGFDAYQSIAEKGYVPEGMSTQNAQLVGWKYGFMQYFKRRLSML